MMPPMYTKAHRWAGEMEEVAEFVRQDAEAAALCRAAAAFCARLSDAAGEGNIAALRALLGRP